MRASHLMLSDECQEQVEEVKSQDSLDPKERYWSRQALQWSKDLRNRKWVDWEKRCRGRLWGMWRWESILSKKCSYGFHVACSRIISIIGEWVFGATPTWVLLIWVRWRWIDSVASQNFSFIWMLTVTTIAQNSGDSFVKVPCKELSLINTGSSSFSSYCKKDFPCFWTQQEWKEP